MLWRLALPRLNTYRLLDPFKCSASNLVLHLEHQKKWGFPDVRALELRVVALLPEFSLEELARTLFVMESPALLAEICARPQDLFLPEANPSGILYFVTALLRNQEICSETRPLLESAFERLTQFDLNERQAALLIHICLQSQFKVKFLINHELSSQMVRSLIGILNQRERLVFLRPDELVDLLIFGYLSRSLSLTRKSLIHVSHNYQKLNCKQISIAFLIFYKSDVRLPTLWKTPLRLKVFYFLLKKLGQLHWEAPLRHLVTVINLFVRIFGTFHQLTERTIDDAYEGIPGFFSEIQETLNFMMLDIWKRVEVEEDLHTLQEILKVCRHIDWSPEHTHQILLSAEAQLAKLRPAASTDSGNP